jgi:hypothetical protein
LFSTSEPAQATLTALVPPSVTSFTPTDRPAAAAGSVTVTAPLVVSTRTSSPAAAV